MKNNMADERWILQLHDEFSYFLVSITFISVVLVIYLLFDTTRKKFPNVTGVFQDTNTCSSPNCVRCTRKALQDSKVLHQKLTDFLGEKKYNACTVTRLKGAIVGDTLNVLQQTRQKPTTLFVPGIYSSPWFDINETCFGSTFTALTDIKNQRTIRQEFYQVFEHLHEGWYKNSTPDGDWFIFHLFNQGVRVEENCRKCPQTTALLDSVELFMKSCAFGNALFSVLLPGTHITPHYGPTNCRVRCHVPLVVPQDHCAIVVDGEEKHWKERKLMLFDDSFLHESWHQGGDSAGPRVVLMLDLWHPGLVLEEREAIMYLFPPST